jgi:prepilin-type N-terminal cleavage/methylation domain-containing protein
VSLSTKKSKEKTGFSLIEVMVSIGVLSIMALAMMTMLDNQNK